MMCKDENVVFIDDPDEEFIDCDEFETISEQRDIDGFELDADKYWAHGWTSSAGEYWRDDSCTYNDRLVRIFPTRYRLKDFVLSKSLRRIIKRNDDLKTVIRPVQITETKNRLFNKHSVRFEEEPFGTLDETFNYLHCYPSKVMELYVLKNRRPLACSIFQSAGKAVYSNAAFWDLNHASRGLGIFTVLLEMQYAVRKKKDFYYLGGFYKQKPNYQYKLRFPGLEFYDWDNDCWIDKRDAAELLDQKPRRKEILPPFKIKELEYLLSAPTHSLFKEIKAVALFGSQASETARPDSDIDVLILTPDIEKHFVNDHYASCFGSFRYARREKWCSFETLRSFYRQENGQIELNFAPPSWAKLPVNEEARRIIRDGMKILHDPDGILEKLQKAALSEKVK